MLPPAPEPTRRSQEQIIAEFSRRRPSYWGLQAPNVLQVLPEPAAGIALTLDFCGGPGGSGTDHAALDMLKRLGVPATLFLNARWIHANQTLTRELAVEPLFELANHGTRHAPLSVTGNSAYGIPGTRSSGQVYDEIMSNDSLLTEITGKRPGFFRPGTAYLDDVAAEITLALGVIPTGFSINADAGATYPAPKVAAETAKARPGDIIISHGNHPGSGTAAGLAAAIPALLDKGYAFTPLGAAFP
ncbi:peptidoglycan/xylan/chitin deacetylase (PgdA/CDA1 family) [Arthrobacter sp. V4I6]|nr:peptidoglycan/xylan/chitin deacetylase (PgdA/CDA1 family) [Arthrobacter sp. V1I7]MDQ0853256.1 peptidoglycan/xylan/chitin deacetylase (PgdA/CDA1 family) [Arthrobacter sp. V4I6]